jgi:hypothetical protein
MELRVDLVIGLGLQQFQSGFGDQLLQGTLEGPVFPGLVEGVVGVGDSGPDNFKEKSVDVDLRFAEGLSGAG